MLVLAAAIVIVGIALFIVGFRGGRIDDHPVCRACGFDLFGVLPAAPVCPECGAKVAPISAEHPRGQAIRIGNRRRRSGLMLSSALLTVLGIALGSYVGWSTLSQGTLNSHKPTWWLLLDIRGKSAADIDAALVELKTRHDMGTLGKDQLLTIVDIGLTRQADPNTPWLPRWGELIETAWRAGALTPEQRTQYARNALHINLLARPEVRRGDILPLTAELDQRVGPGSTFSFQLNLTDLTLGTQTLQPRRFEANGGLIDNTSGLPQPPPQMSITPFAFVIQHNNVLYLQDSRVDLPPGQYTTTAKWHISITAFDGRKSMSWSRAYGADAADHDFDMVTPAFNAQAIAERLWMKSSM